MSEFSGHLKLRAAVREHGRTVLSEQSFRAPFHLSKPYWDEDSRVLLVQVVNPTAGILEGDRLESEIACDSGAAVLVTTPSASRVFRMRDGVAECRQQFSVAEGGWLEVSPEPLVPHRGSRYRQITKIAVERGGGLFYVDQLMPGRMAHGEMWAWERLCIELEVRVGGEWVLRERMDQSGAELQGLAAMAGSGEAGCFANAVLIGSAAEAVDLRPMLRDLHGAGVWAGASALRRGGWSIKLIAQDPVDLRRTLKTLRSRLVAVYPQLGCDPRKL
jgi:urease accessory protein